MTTLQGAAMLIAANSVIFLAGVAGRSSSADVARPRWLPPVWVRAGVPLAIAAGLWFGQPWAWWAAVLMTAVLLFWTSIASFMLALGGFFTKKPGRIALFSTMIAIWIGSLTLLLWR